MNAKPPMPQPGSWMNAQPKTAPGGQRQKTRKSRWQLVLLLLVIILIVVAVLAAADFKRGSTTLSMQVGGQPDVALDLGQSIAISPYLYGSNVFPQTGTTAQDQAGQGMMSYEQAVISGLRSANIKLLRFPGGNWGEQHTPSTEQLNDFSGLLNQVGAEGSMQVPLSDPDDLVPVQLETRASRAALLVDYMNNRQSIQRTDTRAPFHAIKYWSIGNQPDLLTDPDTQKTYTVAGYTQAFITYSLAMHQKDPTIKIFGPELSQYLGQAGPKDAAGQLWMEKFLTDISNYQHTHALPFHLLDGVSLHYYPFDHQKEEPDALLNSSAQLDRLLPPLRQFIRQKFGADLPLAITEINSNSTKNVSSPALAATWWADTVGKLMANQVEYVAFFSTEGVDAPYPLFTRTGLKETAMLRSMQLFTRLQQNLIPTQGNAGPVSMYATQNQAQTVVSVLLINKTNQDQQVKLHAATILPWSPWRAATLTLHAYGLLVVTLHQGGSDEAFSFSNTQDTQKAVPDVQHLVCQSTTDATLVC
ncbi:hypothetical protein KDA_37750 [Dictyobacter alpinus]|uniref:Glycoside hydrolase family 44 catalytic domain-containing protein n=1 Tax=Dictyobacter alpinus TaxID=2014873 RepID=A0A402BA79_9CHLR|nr:glycoside hydrolase family 44 protein [Dictyobacter alpinus]GCE28291.1 hypothetical protein KDA_37750 [Dictyobacter alpinus]